MIEANVFRLHPSMTNAATMAISRENVIIADAVNSASFDSRAADRPVLLVLGFSTYAGIIPRLRVSLRELFTNALGKTFLPCNRFNRRSRAIRKKRHHFLGTMASIILKKNSHFCFGPSALGFADLLFDVLRHWSTRTCPSIMSTDESFGEVNNFAAVTCAEHLRIIHPRWQTE